MYTYSGQEVDANSRATTLFTGVPKKNLFFLLPFHAEWLEEFFLYLVEEVA